MRRAAALALLAWGWAAHVWAQGTVAGPETEAETETEAEPETETETEPETETETEPETEALPSFGATATVSRLGVDEADASAAGTTLLLRDRPRALETLDEVLREAPGARARRTSSYGGFTALSLRGADAEHTTVLLGELPVIAADGSAVDLSTLPTWLFERVEVYRGGAPLWLGAIAIGGVVRLVPREGIERRVEVSGGAGSFDLYQGRASVTVGDRRLSVTSGVGLVSSGGRFPYLDDGGTAFDPSDDGERLRQGAELLEGTGLVHLRARTLGGTLGLVLTGLERTGGLAPPPSRYVEVATGRRSSRRFAGAASLDWLEGGRDVEAAGAAGWRVQLAAGAGLEQRTASDPLAQFGQVPREATDVLARVHARLAAGLVLADWLALTLLGQYAREELASEDRLAGRAIPGSSRDLLAVGLEPRASVDLGDVLLEARVSGRLEGALARLNDPTGERASGPIARELALPTLRASVMARVLRALVISGSFSAATRAPSTIELFGDRGYLAGNVTLRAERSLGGDLGAVLAGSTGALRGRAELRGFASRIEDLIRYQRVSQNQAVPLNVLSARLLGLEVGVSGELLRVVQLHGALTLLDARDESTGAPLPLRPSVVAYARLEGHATDVGPLARLRGFVEVEHVGASSADPAALVVIPERTRLGLGVSASLLGDALRLDVSLRDVFDARGFDVLGLPLPGRSVAVELTASGW